MHAASWSARLCPTQLSAIFPRDAARSPSTGASPQPAPSTRSFEWSLVPSRRASKAPAPKIVYLSVLPWTHATSPRLLYVPVTQGGVLCLAGDADVGPKSCRIAGLQEMGKTSTTQSPVTLRAALRYLPLSTWCCAPAPPSMPPPIPNCEQLTATSGAQTAREIMAHDRYPASIHTGGSEVRLPGGPWAGDYLLGASKGAQRQPQLELGPQTALTWHAA